METDEAGKLRAFREKFGRGWDATKAKEIDDDAAKDVDHENGIEGKEADDNLMDLISAYGQEAEAKEEAMGVRAGKERSGKGKGGER